MKQLRFAQEFIANILNGVKNTTWRVFDDKDLSEGDQLELISSDTEEKFADAQIISIKEKIFGDINEEDKQGVNGDLSEEEMYNKYEKFYKIPITSHTKLKIIKFKLLQ